MISKEEFKKRIIQIQQNKNKLKQIAYSKRNKIILPEVFFEDEELILEDN